MTGLEVVESARDAIYLVVVVSAPLMITGLVVGLAVSLFQVLTQIQEMTLAYVPKIIATFIVLMASLPFMAETMRDHMTRTIIQITLQK